MNVKAVLCAAVALLAAETGLSVVRTLPPNTHSVCPFIVTGNKIRRLDFHSRPLGIA